MPKLALKLILPIILAVFAFNLPSLGAVSPSGDFTYWVTGAGNAVISQYHGKTANLVVPSEIDGYPVTEIGNWVFGDCKTLVSVEIPDSVVKIADYAFTHCYDHSFLRKAQNGNETGQCFSF